MIFITPGHLLIWTQEACTEKGIDLTRISEENGITKLDKALTCRIYRFIKRNRISRSKINRANHVDKKEIGHRSARCIRNHRRLREGLNIEKTSLECIEEVRVFESHLTERSQTLEFVGAKDVCVRKIANPKAAHSLMIYTRSCGNQHLRENCIRRIVSLDVKQINGLTRAGNPNR